MIMVQENQAAKGISLQGYLMLRGLILPLPRNKKVYIGRDKGTCDITLPDQRVSKQHVVITHENAKYFIRDLGSLNHTYLNNEPLNEKMALVPGDEIRVTPYSMLFIGPDQIDAGAAAHPAETKDDASHFSGQLSILKISDLIQLINNTAQSGLLTIKDPRHRQAKVTFVEGEIASALFGEFRGEEAVYALLGTSEGSFIFERGLKTLPPDPIRKRTQTILFEAAQFLDESQISEEKKGTKPLSAHPIFSPADEV